MIEQVKGFSYSVFSLLGTNSSLSTIPGGQMSKVGSDQQGNVGNSSNRSQWRIPLTHSEIKDSSSSSSCSIDDLYYCVLYLRPGDYHRIHSPIDWNILIRRHFTGHLYPTNQRASRSISNLYIENERVVLEGQWQGGFMAMAAIGATNVGSIELLIEPELKTNLPRRKLRSCADPDERSYEPEGGKLLKKGEEVGAFNLGSTVVLVFQAPTQKPMEDGKQPSKFKFGVQCGDRIHVGEALGRWL